MRKKELDNYFITLKSVLEDNDLQNVSIMSMNMVYL